MAPLVTNSLSAALKFFVRFASSAAVISCFDIRSIRKLHHLVALVRSHQVFTVAVAVGILLERSDNDNCTRTSGLHVIFERCKLSMISLSFILIYFSLIQIAAFRTSGMWISESA
jgi:hypothetical protein